jgi:hypothetical protein
VLAGARRVFPPIQKPWTDEIVRAADVVITMGCGDPCPLFPGKRYEDWTLDDPAGKTIEEIRPIRDEIERIGRISSTNSTRPPASEPAQRPHRITPVPALRNAQR